MTTQLAVANLALAHLAIGKPIVAMTDARQEARVMTQFYDQVRDEAFRDFPWPFARKFAVLATALVAGPTPPASLDFAYSYRYPADCLYARDILIGPRRPMASGGTAFPFPTAFGFPAITPPHVPYSIGSDGTGLLIYTDAAPDTTNGLPVLEYTVDVDEARWAPDFAAAVSFKLAWYAAPTLTAGDPHQLGTRALNAYFDVLARARASARNEQSDDPDPDSAFITSRY